MSMSPQLTTIGFVIANVHVHIVHPPIFWKFVDANGTFYCESYTFTKRTTCMQLRASCTNFAVFWRYLHKTTNSDTMTKRTNNTTSMTVVVLCPENKCRSKTDDTDSIQTENLQV